MRILRLFCGVIEVKLNEFLWESFLGRIKFDSVFNFIESWRLLILSIVEMVGILKSFFEVVFEVSYKGKDKYNKYDK